MRSLTRSLGSLCALGAFLLLALWPLPLAAPPAHARPILPRIMSLGPAGTDLRAPAGVLSAANQDTVRFGGTFWNADSSRWQAIEDSVWTFDSGVGSNFNHDDPFVYSYKDPSLHAYMEGWVGFDVSYTWVNPYFRRMASTDPGWGPAICVGSAAGLGGTYSFWAGVLPDEAANLCYAGGQGYGNGWNVAVEHRFWYPGAGSVTLEYDYAVEVEPGFDYAYAEVDTGDGEARALTQYTGAVSGHESLTLLPGMDLPSGADTIRVLFRAYSDGAYSDEDGGFNSTCGAFAVDDIGLTGGIAAGPFGFETGDEGWALMPPAPGVGGDWSNLADLSDLPPALTACPCALRDSVLLFDDITSGGHGAFQDNLAASPWIDLRAAGQNGAPGKIVEYDMYADLPLLNYVFVQVNVQWYPQVCPVNGKLRVSPFTSHGYFYYPFSTSGCNIGSKYVDYFSDIVDPGAEQMRIALGVISYCRFFGNCTGVSNTTPWFDNVTLTTFGSSDAPFLSASGVDLPQDSFPANGTLSLDAPGRVDCNNIKGDSQPEVGTALGDTLIVAGGSQGSGANLGVEVRVQFAVDFGPGAPAGTAAWLAKHQVENVWRGQQWYSARMDTAEQHGSLSTGNWMSAYHEDDPNFVDLGAGDRSVDPNDPYPDGSLGRLANDIFPEGPSGLFTMGTRVNLFYKARYLDANGTPTTGDWFVFPDTSKAPPLEMEVLPSSAAADSTWNCVLYVDHFNRGSQGPIEDALAAILPGGSGNFENTAWDRWDVNAESSQQASFGRPYGTEYGASLQQTFAYRTIIWNSGNLSAFNLTEEDADVLIPWLHYTGGAAGQHRLYLSGDGIARSMTLEAASEPSALNLLNDWLGVSWTCDSVRDASCPGTPAVAEMASCIDVDPTLGGHFTGSSGTAVLEGNYCPQRRSFDVLYPFSGAHGDPRGNETYWGPTKGMVDFESVSNRAVGEFDYKAVVDGGSVHYRRGPGCTGSGPIQNRLSRVLGWFGYPGAGTVCSDGSAGLDTPVPEDATPVNSLGLMSPNPLLPGAAGTIRFSLAERGPARIEVLDVSGRLVDVIVDAVLDAGDHQALWHGTTSEGRRVASGVYFYHMKTGTREFARKLVVVGS